MKKNYLFFLVLISICACCIACEKENKNMYHELNKLHDYLYEITYDDYKLDNNLEENVKVEKFACSSVRNGNYYGRNFDFIFNDVPEFVVKVNKTKNRHASIGVAIASTIHKSNDLEKDYREYLEYIPNFTLDGINDAGVICSDNVVSKQDVTPITGTNPNGEKLYIGYIVRFVLDNANSADHAIELLKERNIYGDLGDHYNLHFMIADKNKTYIAEFIDNKLVVEEKQGDEQIMTNYYVNTKELTENAMGIERYDILKNNYNEGNTFDGMWNLMQRVKYSTTYLFNNEVEWYSEFFTQSVINNGIDEETLKKLDDMKKDYWVSRTYDKRVPSNLSYWFTNHNSTYDIETKKLRVTVQEDYNNYYEFTLK